MTTRVLLVDDHALIREGLRRAFERQPDFEVATEADSVASAVDALARELVDVAIFDVRLPDGSGLQAIKQARGKYPDLGIVVLTMYAGDDELFAARDAGASAFVPKDAPVDEVVLAARHAATSPKRFVATNLTAATDRRASPPVGPQLSPREREVLGLLAHGLSIAQIAQKLFISESTTKTHVSNVYEKLGASNRAQALMSALQLALIEAPQSHATR